MVFRVIVGIGLLLACIGGTYVTWGDITGGAEVEQWVNITITNMNATMLISLGAIGGLGSLLFYRVHRRYK